MNSTQMRLNIYNLDEMVKLRIINSVTKWESYILFDYILYCLNKVKVIH